MMFLIFYAIPLLMLAVMVVQLIRTLREANRQRAEMTNSSVAVVSQECFDVIEGVKIKTRFSHIFMKNGLLVFLIRKSH